MGIFSLLRLFDFLFALIGLLILSPVLLLLTLLGFLDSGSPLFRQKRLGYNKKTFMLIKFRTMVVSARSVPTHLVCRSSVTRYGAFLRRTKIDELPQLWNVLKGEMSLVGPRPGLPEHVDLITARASHGVFSVRPGITGLSQISSIDMSAPELLAKTDAEMIRTMSVAAYFKYLVVTLVGKGAGDNVR